MRKYTMEERMIKNFDEMTENELEEALMKRMVAEQTEFEERLKSQTVEEVLHNAYQFVVQQNILYAVLNCGILSVGQTKALLQSGCTLSDLYDAWLDIDTSAFIDEIREFVKDEADHYLGLEY